MMKLAEKHNMPLSAISTMLKNKGRILKAYGKKDSLKHSRIQLPTYLDVEEALILMTSTWLTKMMASAAALASLIM